MRIRGVVSLCVAVTLLVSPMVRASSDGIVLTVNRGASPSEVALQWSGGNPDYEVYRGLTGTSTLEPGNLLGTTSGVAWSDTPPAAAIQYYQIVSHADGPFIGSIAPPRASFGQRITIYGSGFGSDRSLVHVRFSFTDSGSGQNLTIDQPALTVNPTHITLDVPLAVPNRVNQVRVIVAAQMSPTVGYLVGALPNDPTPAVKGNETLLFLDKLDELAQHFDARLDTWFVTTGTGTQEQTDAFHQDIAEIRAALAVMHGDFAAANPDSLAVTDVLVSTRAVQDALATVQRGIDALHGSPLGTVMCEGTDVRNAMRDVADALNIVADIMSIVSTAANIACAASAIAAIFTFGAASPLAVFLCSVAATINSFVVPIMQAVENTAEALDAIANAAPIDPVPFGFAATMSHPLWGGDPPVVYVAGTIPVEVESTQDFENAACNPSGCDAHFEITIWGIDIPIDFTIPYNPVPDLPVRCSLMFPPGTGGAGFSPQGTANDGAICQFTGADVNGPSWVRGMYNVEARSDCGGQTLGPAVFTKQLVSGPRLFSVSPSTVQLRDTIEMFGQYMPPHAGGATFKAEARFGDVGTYMSDTVADHYTFTTPDTNNLAGTVGLRVQGRDADQTVAFHVLPPVLTFARIDPGFVGEEVELHGTGFATNPVNNVLTLNGQLVPQGSVVRSEPFGLVFRIPPGATSGPLQLSAATHTSNQIGFGVRKWGTAPGVQLSHSARNAYHPVVAAAYDDGTAGIAWIDRNAGGGELRLLFTDASPNDSGFRTPIAIAPTVAGSELAGPPSAPPAPDVAIGPNHNFHAVWATASGTIRMASFAKGASPATSVVAIAPAVGTVLRDPTVAVMADGSVHVAATQVPMDGGVHSTLLHARSTNGGASFSAPIAFMAPGIGTTSDDLQLGDVDLTYANALLWRSWTQWWMYTDPIDGDSSQREVFTQTSSDGINWTVPQGASAGQVDVPHTGIATSARNAPSVSGDASGAVVAWDASTTKPYNPIPNQPTEIYASRSAMVNSEPYLRTGIGIVTPDSVGRQTDVGHSSLVHHTPGGNAMTAIATVRRIPGTSPDALSGVPRLHVRRFPLRDFSNPTLFETSPTVANGDTTTQDAEPSLAVDGQNHYHLASLQGPAGHRVVRYQSTRGLVWPDTLPDNPSLVPASPRDVIAVNMGNDQDEFGSLFHWGVLLVDPAHPEETRWAGVSPVNFNNSFVGRPSFSSDGAKLMMYGGGSLYGTCEASLDGETRLVALDHPAEGVYMTTLRYPVFSPDGRIYGGYGELIRNEPGTSTFTHLAPPSGWGRFHGLSWTGRYVASTDSDFILHIYEPATNNERFNFAFVTSYEWAPAADKIAFLDGSAHQDVYEWDLVTDTISGPFAGAHAIEPQLSYKPDSSDIAYACRGFDCCTPVGFFESAICTTAGLIVPHIDGWSDRAPLWSPDGTAIAFIRVDPATNLGQLMIWHPGDLAATPLTGPVLGAAANYELAESTWKRIPQ